MNTTLQVFSNTEVLTMTSLELVDVINMARQEEFGDDARELRHADFLAKVMKVLGNDERKFSSVYLGGNGEERKCYKFPKREATLMVMSESYKVQAAVYDRLQDLENGVYKLPETKLGWMELAVDTERKYQGALALTHQQAEFILEQETEIKELTPKADWVDNYVGASSSILYKFRQVVHLLDTKERIFRAWLVDNKIMYKLNSNWTCYAEYKDLKYFESFVNKSLPHKSDIYFTSKGFEWISKKWDKHVASQSI